MTLECGLCSTRSRWGSMVPQENGDAVRRSLLAEESCSLHFALVTAAEVPPLPLLQALCCFLQDSSTPCLWTWESSRGRVQSPASSGVSSVSLVFQRTQFRGVGPSQQHLLMIQQLLEGVFFLLKTWFLLWGAG